MSRSIITEEQKQTLIEYIDSGNLEDLKQYFQYYNIQRIKEDDLNFLIFHAISRRSSLEMIKILEKGIEKEKVCTPLGYAIMCHRNDIADFLIKKINSQEIVELYLNEFLMEAMITYDEINNAILLYMKEKGFWNDKISFDLIIRLINEFSQGNLDFLFKTFVYDTNFIIRLLGYYTHKVSLSHKELEDLLSQEKNKIKVTENMYKQAEEKRIIVWQ